MSNREESNTPSAVNISMKLATSNDEAVEVGDKTKTQDKWNEDAEAEQQKESESREGEKDVERNRLGMQVLQDALQEGDPDNDNASFDIVAVHGLNRDHENTWTTEETDSEQSQNWLKNEIHKAYPRSRILSFSYEISDSTPDIFTRSNIRRVALQLLDSLLEHRNVSDLTKSHILRPIVFLMHDLGGIIVKEALWIADLEGEKYWDIQDCTRLLIFFACPHRSSDTQDMEGQIAKLMLAEGRPRLAGILEYVQETTRSVIDINASFILSNMPARKMIVSVYSEEENSSLQIFNRNVATLDTVFEEKIGRAKIHRDICKFSPSVDSWQRIRQLMGRRNTPLRPYQEAAGCLKTFQSQAAPNFPLKLFLDSKYRFENNVQSEIFTSWFAGQRPNILHVREISREFEISTHITRYLDVHRTAEEKEIIIYFTFCRRDDRYNTAEAMLESLIFQVLNHHQILYDDFEILYELMMLHCHSWTFTDLLFCFQRILTSNINSEFICIINGLEECINLRMTLLNYIFRLASLTGNHCKYIITTTDDSDVRAALCDWPVITPDDYLYEPATAENRLEVDIAHEILRLRHYRPELQGLEGIIRDSLIQCGHDKDLRRLILMRHRLNKCSSTKLAKKRVLRLASNATPQDHFLQILTEIAPENRPWARKALTWILYAFRPLTTWELGAVLAFDGSMPWDRGDDRLVYQQVTKDLDQIFGGLFVIEHNEVRFGHSKAREFLISQNGGERDTVWYDVNKTAHQEITNDCLSYLSLEQGRHLASPSFDNSHTTLSYFVSDIHASSLYMYATKYWFRHFEVVPEIYGLGELALKFFENVTAMHRWAEVYWKSSNPVTRTDRSFVSILPVLACLGLLSILKHLPDLRADTPQAAKDRALALIEAARNNHVDVVHELLLYGKYDQATLQNALIAGISDGTEALIDDLIAYAAINIDNFEWPTMLLCLAAHYGLEAVLRRLLYHGASVEKAVTLYGFTPMHFVARTGHVEIAKLLIAHKSSVSKLGKYSQTPLHVASGYGQRAIVKLLLEAGADINAKDDFFRTPLYLACLERSNGVVELLSEEGCDLECGENSQVSSLVLSADRNSYECVVQLLKAKANVEAHGPTGWTALRYAAFDQDQKLCRLLLENGADVNTSSGGDPLLFHPASTGDLEMVTFLVDNKADVNAVGSDGWTALLKASNRGHKSVVAYLLNRGADVDRKNDNGEGSVFLAAKSGFAETVKLLIDKGADNQATTITGWAPIHAAYDNLETSRILLDNGVDINSVANDYTPLYLAAYHNHAEVVKLMLEYGPDLEISYTGSSYQEGYSALLIAIRGGHGDVVRLLLEAGADINHRATSSLVALHFSSVDNNEDVLRILMEYNPDLNAIDDDGNTPLHYILNSTSLSVIKILVNAGADLEARSKGNLTPICMAVDQERIDITRYLIMKKAELNIAGGRFGGPLHLACYWHNLELVKMIVMAGADINLVDPTIGTPLQASLCRWEPVDLEKQESVISYLFDRDDLNISLVGGNEGCPLNLACGRSTPQVVKRLLKRGGAIDIEDYMGRVAVHFAASRSLETLYILLDARANILSKDKIGRTALHWAVIGGSVDVVREVISLSRTPIDQADNDGWTPLLWAARGGSLDGKSISASAHEDMISFLLARGADPCVKGKGMEKDWSPIRLARYHGSSPTVIKLLIRAAKKKLAADGEKEAWDEEFHASQKAVKRSGFCDGCYGGLFGILYKCETCLDFDFCYKCILSREIAHPPDHNFKSLDMGFEPILVQEEEDKKEEEAEEDEEDEDEVDEEDEPDETERKINGELL